MPMLNNIDGGPLPISIYANAVDSIIQLDKTYEQFLWESGYRKAAHGIRPGRCG